MLVNLTPDRQEQDRRKLVAEEYGFSYTPQDHKDYNTEVGIYQSTFPFNFPQEEFIEFKGKHNIGYERSYELFAPNYSKNQYGVADSIEQLKEYFKEEVECLERKFFIEVTPVWQDKSKVGQGGGWRWHKWGSYIGKLEPQCEYLDDEDFGQDFEYVLVYHIYEV